MKAPHHRKLSSGEEPFMSMKLCIHINADAGFQFNCDAVIPDGYLLDPASHQCFIEFCKIGGLLCDVILQVIDSLYLFVPCGCINGCFLTEFSESEDLMADTEDDGNIVRCRH